MYVNTLLIQQVLAEPAWQGRLTAVDLRALSPLKWQHVNPYGPFALNMQARLQTIIETSPTTPFGFRQPLRLSVGAYWYAEFRSLPDQLYGR